MKQPAGNFDRYTELAIENALEDAQLEAARLTRCLRSFAIIILKDGYSQYKPPSQMILPLSAFFYQSATSYYELSFRTKRWLDRYIPGWRTTNGDPLTMYMGENYGSVRKIGFYPTPDTDGTEYESADDTGIFVSETGMTASGNITGTNSAASATVCTDSASRTLSDLGVVAGMIILNNTDGSQGQITSVSGSTVTLTLSGGTANTWAVGDAFTILSGEYGVITDWANDEKYLFGADIGGMTDVRTVVNNVVLDFVRRPLKLVSDTQYPEIPPELHQYLPDGAVWILKRGAPRGTDDLAEAQTSYQIFSSGIMAGYTDFDLMAPQASHSRYYL